MTDHKMVPREPTTGMTLRDYFAAAVLRAIVTREERRTNEEISARLAYLYADAMIKERDK